MELLAAYKAWVALAPFKTVRPRQEFEYMRHTGEIVKVVEPTRYDGDCCGAHGHLDQYGNKRPDHEVCDRERAWRKYVSLRDQH